MNISLTLNKERLEHLYLKIANLPWFQIIIIAAFALSYYAIIFSYKHDYIIAYGDAESHLNIAKRVVSGLTPGMAQLGGIWLPFPHLLMIPFVYFDPLWRTGIAGAIISAVAFITTSICLYKLTYLFTKSTLASVAASAALALNPNVLYMQSTPMTELPLIAFFMLSSYFFIKYLRDDKDYLSLILASFFGFCATLTRYDGWFLVLIEAATIILRYGVHRKIWQKMQGRLVLFSTLAFFGIALWLLWNFLILGDPLYFTNSQFSAKSQQQGFLARGELPAYKNLVLSLSYYTVTSMSDMGIMLFFVSLTGFVLFIINKSEKYRYYYVLILLVPFIFNVLTLYLGASIIFIPHLTPVGFQWRLFNVRYGLMMVPVLAFFFGYMFYKAKWPGRMLIIFLFLFQFVLYFIGYSKVITLADGVEGLSAGSKSSASYWKWVAAHYDHGLVLIDDYARTLSIIRSGIPMQNIIYVGTKPYWPESLKQPEKYATWIIMQKNDDVWKNVYDNPTVRARLYKYFQKVYTSPDILIFKRNEKVH